MFRYDIISDFANVRRDLKFKISLFTQFIFRVRHSKLYSLHSEVLFKKFKALKGESLKMSTI